MLHHHVQFEKIDPLGDGLDDDIAAERREEVITLEDHPDETALEKYWQFVEEDIHKDPEWFTFADGE